MFRGIVRKSKGGRECLIYKHPDVSQKCRVFLKIQEGGGHCMAVCAKCKDIVRKSDESARSLARIPVTDCTFGFNPLRLTHLPGCSPSKFRSVMEKFDSFAKALAESVDGATESITDLVEERETREGEEEPEKETEGRQSGKKRTDRDGTDTHYPVDVCMSAVNPTYPIFVCKISEKTNECYKYLISNGYRSCLKLPYRVFCSGCRNWMSAFRRNKYKGRMSLQLTYLNCDGSHLLSDPMTNHLPGCQPMDYDEFIKKAPLVTVIVKEKIIRGENISQYLSPLDSPFPKPLHPLKEYPIEMSMNPLNTILPKFIYRLQDCPRECYTFSCTGQLFRKCKGNFLVRCDGCRSAYTKERDRSGNSQSVLSRRTDGRRMLSDPLSGHLPGCKPYDYKEILKKTPLVSDTVKERIINGKETDDDAVKLDSPIGSRRRKRRRMRTESDSESRDDRKSRLNENVTLAMENDDSKTAELAESSIANRPSTRKREKRIRRDRPTRKAVIESGSLDDLKGETEETQAGFSSSLRSLATERENLREIEIVTIDSESESEDFCNHEEKEEPRTNADDSQSAIATSSQDHEEHPEPAVCKEFIKPNKNRARQSEEIEIVTIVSDSEPELNCDGQFGQEHSDNVSPSHTSLLYQDDSTPADSVQKVPMDPPKKFKKKFDALIFNEEDVNVNVLDGGLLRVLFERKTLSSTPSRTSLLYELPLPSYVDSHSLRTSWREHTHTLIVRAKTKTSRML